MVDLYMASTCRSLQVPRYFHVTATIIVNSEVDACKEKKEEETDNIVMKGKVLKGKFQKSIYKSNSPPHATPCSALFGPPSLPHVNA